MAVWVICCGFCCGDGFSCGSGEPVARQFCYLFVAGYSFNEAEGRVEGIHEGVVLPLPLWVIFLKRFFWAYGNDVSSDGVDLEGVDES